MWARVGWGPRPEAGREAWILEAARWIVLGGGRAREGEAERTDWIWVKAEGMEKGSGGEDAIFGGRSGDVVEE